MTPEEARRLARELVDSCWRKHRGTIMAVSGFACEECTAAALARRTCLFSHGSHCPDCDGTGRVHEEPHGEEAAYTHECGACRGTGERPALARPVEPPGMSGNCSYCHRSISECDHREVWRSNLMWFHAAQKVEKSVEFWKQAYRDECSSGARLFGEAQDFRRRMQRAEDERDRALLNLAGLRDELDAARSRPDDDAPTPSAEQIAKWIDAEAARSRPDDDAKGRP